MHKSLLLLLVSASLIHAGTTIFQENFENGGEKRFEGLVTSRTAPGEGAVSVIEPHRNDAGRNSSYAYTHDLYPIKPDTWYRLSFLHRNDIKIGEINVAVQESRDASKMNAAYYAWQRKALPLNIDSWQRYSHEFKTMPTTKAFRLHLAFDNEGSGGCAQWDDIKIEEIEKITPHLVLEPFRAAATYTDIPTRLSRRVTDGNHAIVDDLVFHSKIFWETLDLPTEPIELAYNNVAKGATLRGTVTRAGQCHYKRELKLEGSGKASFLPHVEALPEGKFIFKAELIQDGKSIESVSKEIWRIAKSKYPTPQLPPIKTVSAGPNRQILVNGKVFHPVSVSMVPGQGYISHHMKNALPSYPEYLATFREQFELSFVSGHTWKGPDMDNKTTRDFAEQSIKSYRKALDFAQENNFYCRISFTIGTHQSGKRFLFPPEDVTYIVNQLKDHPALYAWCVDEPEVGKHSPEQMTEWYNAIKAADPNHIVHVNLCDPKKYHLYANCTDVSSQDVYPFPMMSLEESDYRMKKLAQAFPTAPAEDYLQAFNFNGLAMPTFDQVRASLLLDAMFDCHALAIFAWGFHSDNTLLTDPELQGYMRTIIMMFHGLQDLRDHGTPLELPVQSQSRLLRTRAYSMNGKTVLILLNISNELPLDLNCRLDGVRAVDYFDSAWSYPLQDGVLSLTLPPNGAQVLAIEK